MNPIETSDSSAGNSPVLPSTSSSPKTPQSQQQRKASLTSLRRPNHNENERRRRRELRQTIIRLRDKIPNLVNMENASANLIVNRAIVYIEHMQRTLALVSNSQPMQMQPTMQFVNGNGFPRMQYQGQSIYAVPLQTQNNTSQRILNKNQQSLPSIVLPPVRSPPPMPFVDGSLSAKSGLSFLASMAVASVENNKSK